MHFTKGRSFWLCNISTNISLENHTLSIYRQGKNWKFWPFNTAWPHNYVTPLYQFQYNFTLDCYVDIINWVKNFCDGMKILSEINSIWVWSFGENTMGRKYWTTCKKTHTLTRCVLTTRYCKLACLDITLLLCNAYTIFVLTNIERKKLILPLKCVNILHLGLASCGLQLVLVLWDEL